MKTIATIKNTEITISLPHASQPTVWRGEISGGSFVIKDNSIVQADTVIARFDSKEQAAKALDAIAGAMLGGQKVRKPASDFPWIIGCCALIIVIAGLGITWNSLRLSDLSPISIEAEK